MSSIFDISKNENPELETIYTKAMEELNEFFQMNWELNRPKIYVVKDRETAESIRNMETPDWVVGWNNNGIVFVLSKEVFSSASKTGSSDDDYRMLITHELAHLFFRIITGGKTQPNWLWEGVSILAAGQAQRWDKPVRLNGFLDNRNVYSEAGYALLLLSKKFGREKLVQMLKNYKTFAGDFSILFHNTFNLELNYITFNKLFEEQ